MKNLILFIILVLLISFSYKEDKKGKYIENYNDELIVLGIKEIENPRLIYFYSINKKYSSYFVYIEEKDTSKIEGFKKGYSFLQNTSCLAINKTSLTNRYNPLLKLNIDSIQKTIIDFNDLEPEETIISKRIKCYKFNGKRKFIHGLIKVSFYNNLKIEDKPIILEDSPNLYVPFLYLIE